MSEDLVERCAECDFCVFEYILLPEQRKKSLLNQKFHPTNHAHRDIIEQVCGKHNDNKCEVKYVVMRSNHTDYTLAQLGAINEYRWDSGKGHKREVSFEELAKSWVAVRDYGRGFPESYAQRFRDVWNLTVRNGGDKQTHTVLGIYEIVVSPGERYGEAIAELKKRREESKRRDQEGLKN
jgi:hypothetical protein